MANILFIFNQAIIANDIKNLICFYDGIINSLIDSGNNVCVLNKIYAKHIGRENIQRIKEFNPDLIIAFNNAIFSEIIKNTQCPILVYAADTYNFFEKKDLINKYRERYYFATTDFDTDDYEAYFQKNRLISLHPATAIKYDNLEKRNNISFIGEPFGYDVVPQEFNNKVYQALLECYKTGNYDYENLLKKQSIDCNLTQSQIWGAFDIRVSILNTLLELGLNLYGLYWDRLSPLNNQLTLAFNNTPVYSLKHNQDIYNSSFININIQHPQNKGKGMAWRVYDIMASSGLLISHQSTLLNQLTKGHVAIPMFNSPLEAADLCRKYLKEEHLREDIISASNEFIKKYGRWEDNFEAISDITGVKLLNNEKGKGEISFIENKNAIVKKKSRVVNVRNGYRLILSNLPIIEKLYTDKKLKKLYSSIDEYRLI